MLLGCVSSFIDLIGGERLVLSSVSVVFAVLILYILKKYSLSTKLRISLIYGHLFFLFFPAALFTANLACGAACMPCHNDMYALAGYALPSALLLTALAGFVVLPAFYIFSNKKRKITDAKITGFVSRYAERMSIKAPEVYAIDKAKPVAFSFRSFRSAIFLSVGLLDILKKKEVEAILLHELAHLKHRSSALKFSNFLLRFSPLSLLARFHHDAGKEERKADAFVVKEQGTDRHLKGAKRKISCFYTN